MSADLAWFGGTFEATDTTLAALADHVASITTLNAQYMHADEPYCPDSVPPAITVATDGFQGTLSVHMPIIVPVVGDEHDEHRARLSSSLHSLYGFLLSHFDAGLPERPMCGEMGLMQPPSFGAVWDDLKGLAPECSLADAPIKGKADGTHADAPKTVWLTLPNKVDTPLQTVVDVAAREFAAAHAPVAVDRMFGPAAVAVPVFAKASDAMKAAAADATGSVAWHAAVIGEHRDQFLRDVGQNQPTTCRLMDAF